MLKRGTNAQFRDKISLPMGVTLHPRREHALPVAVVMLKAVLPMDVKI